MGKKMLCTDIVTGRIELATGKNEDGFFRITGETEDVTEDAVKVVMTYMDACCKKDGEPQVAFEIKGLGRLIFVREKNTVETAETDM